MAPDREAILKSNFEPKDNNKVIIHGFNSDMNLAQLLEMKEGQLKLYFSVAPPKRLNRYSLALHFEFLYSKVISPMGIIMCGWLTGVLWPLDHAIPQ